MTYLLYVVLLLCWLTAMRSLPGPYGSNGSKVTDDDWYKSPGVINSNYEKDANETLIWVLTKHPAWILVIPRREKSLCHMSYVTRPLIGGNMDFFFWRPTLQRLKLPFHERNQFHHRAFFFFINPSQRSFHPAILSELKKDPPIPISIPRLPSSLPLLLTMRFPFLQNYKVLKRTARTKALWKVVLLEVKRHCRYPSIHTVLMLWFVFFPLQ